MWTQLPPGVWVVALVTILYSFLCLFASVLMLWLTWAHHERLSYVALIAYLTLLCTLCSIPQQLYEYEHWEEFMWAQHYHIQANPNDANAWFNNGNFGFRLVLSNIRLFTNDAAAMMILSFSISITGTVYSYWAAHQRAERLFSSVSKVVPIVLAALSVALLQVPAVQASWPAYMVVANGLSVVSCALSFGFFIAIVTQYVRSKRSVETWRSWLQHKTRGILARLRSGRERERRVRQQLESNSSSSDRTGSGAVTTNASWAQVSLSAHSIYDSWLVTRLLILALMLWVFIIVTLVTHIQEKDHVAQDAKADGPNLTSAHASDAILGYMPAVTPGLLLFIVFGTTKTLRQTMYDTFVPRQVRLRSQRRRDARQIAFEPSPVGSPNPLAPGDGQAQNSSNLRLPPGAKSIRTSEVGRKSSGGLGQPRVVTMDIEMGDWSDGPEEPRNRALANTRSGSRPGRGSSTHSSLIE